jgi:hypothetical protein
MERAKYDHQQRQSLELLIKVFRWPPDDSKNHGSITWTTTANSGKEKGEWVKRGENEREKEQGCVRWNKTWAQGHGFEAKAGGAYLKSQLTTQ